MFEKFTDVAEQAATNVSRRQMLGHIGRAAAAAAAVLASLLQSHLEAAGGGFCTQCDYLCPDGSTFGIAKRGRHCHEERDGCILVFSETVPCGGGT
jgi:hypothetical protein